MGNDAEGGDLAGRLKMTSADLKRLSQDSALRSDVTANVVKPAFAAMTPEEQRELVQALSTTIGAPSGDTRDHIWLIIIRTFATILVGSFITLAAGLFIPMGGKVAPELVLTMFTSVIGFLAGLFVPTPLARKRNG